MISLSPNYRALVIGSSGSIGKAFTDRFKQDPQCAEVLELCRASSPGFDLRDAQSIESALAPIKVKVKAKGSLDLIIDATGALTIDGKGPEKSLQSVDASALNASLWVNCIGPSIVLKNLVPILGKNRCIYAKLSARVGSISDNKLGGWYSYRSSKAAFNMMLHTAAIEFNRKNPNALFVALQPGTVSSALSSPFVDPSKTLSPEESVNQMLADMELLQQIRGAHFIDYKGNPIAW